MKAKHLALFTLWFCAPLSKADPEPDIIFLPAGKNSAVGFEGETQAGKEIHRIEVRRLGFRVEDSADDYVPTQSLYIVYFAGKEYGPTVLKRIDGHSPLVKKSAANMVTIYYITGASTHVKQTWKLLGSIAELEEEKKIEAHDRPDPNGGEPGATLGVGS